jgi:hypothetical protein
MIENYREFEAGPDPYGRTWRVRFLWQQNGISIRHSDTVDVKFLAGDGEIGEEKVIAMPHPRLLELSRKTAHPLNDAWCMKLAGLHLKRMIETGEDLEKALVTMSLEDMRKAHEALGQARAAA